MIVCPGVFDWLNLSDEERLQLIINLHQRRRNCLIESKKKRQKESKSEKKKEEALSVLTPELKDLFEKMDPKMKKLLF